MVRWAGFAARPPLAVLRVDFFAARFTVFRAVFAVRRVLDLAAFRAVFRAVLRAVFRVAFFVPRLARFVVFFGMQSQDRLVQPGTRLPG